MALCIPLVVSSSTIFPMILGFKDCIFCESFMDAMANTHAVNSLPLYWYRNHAFYQVPTSLYHLTILLLFNPYGLIQSHSMCCPGGSIKPTVCGCSTGQTHGMGLAKFSGNFRFQVSKFQVSNFRFQVLPNFQEGT